MAVLLIVGVVFLVFIVGMLLAWLFSRADRVVTHTRTAMELEERAYSPATTLGFRILPQANYEQQMGQARQEAAKRAAALPRGGNSRIGRAGDSTLKPASKNTANDPMTAVRIARFHGWDGARTGIQAAVPVAAASTGVVTAAAPAAVVGVASPALIAITPDMSPEEVRKARIANSKAEAAYNKALKAASSGAPVAATATVAAPAIAGVSTVAAAPVAVGVELPKLIEITPDMSPEEIRKARVANAKAQSAYNKALKAAGVTTGAAATDAAPAVEMVASSATAVAVPAAMPGIEPPALIDITDSMSPEEIRKARVANAKAQSAYSKALKAAGFDPSTSSTPVVEAMPDVAAASVATVQQTSPAPSVAGIDAPKLIEITDSMSPEEIRRARVDNAKMMSAYNKALKAAGIDPASVK